MEQTIARYRQMIKLAMQRRDMERVKFLVGIVVLMKGCNGRTPSPLNHGPIVNTATRTTGDHHVGN